MESNPVLEETGRRYYEFRGDLMRRSDVGLTTVYNSFHDPGDMSNEIVDLRRLHDAMDRAALDAYGWTDLQPVCDFFPEFDDEEEDQEDSTRKKKRFRYRWPEEIPKEQRQPQAKPPSPRQAAMLLARRPERLKPHQQQLLARLNECCPEVPILYTLTQDFGEVFRSKQEKNLQNWLDQARRTGLPEIGRFCDGLQRDAVAVKAAVTMSWSNGQVEGQINRLKLVKRQMYGRAKFNLLRCRVLPYVPGSMSAPPTRAP
jgi:hypothetical protein